MRKSSAWKRPHPRTTPSLGLSEFSQGSLRIYQGPFYVGVVLLVCLVCVLNFKRALSGSLVLLRFVVVRGFPTQNPQP